MDRVVAPDSTSDSVPRTLGVQCVCAFLHVTVSPDLASILTASGHFVNPHELEIWSVSKAHFFKLSDLKMATNSLIQFPLRKSIYYSSLSMG